MSVFRSRVRKYVSRRSRRFAAAVTVAGFFPLIARANDNASAGEPNGGMDLLFFADSAGRAWNFRVLRVGETDVFVSQILVALILLVAGITLARAVSRRVGRRLVDSTSLDISAATTVEKLLFYTASVIVILLALQTMQIPIGMFALFGGAIAIGVGFGTQTIFRNFISGLILMFDRPIRIGDTVEVSENYGRIADIGARCTRLRRFDGIDVLVPNSQLIENDVINWTLADKHVRQVVRVGIAYGSDVLRAARLLEQAANEQPEILRTEQRYSHVLLEDFGDNALVLDLYFWVELTESVSMRIIRSSIRFRVDELFREAGIVVAFPQRDIHIDAQRPLEVRMVPSGNDPGPGRD